MRHLPLSIRLRQVVAGSLADATTYADSSEDAPTLFSTADLTIGGTGALTVTGNSNNGILDKDYLVLTDGTVTVDSVGDAFKSDNTEDAGSDFVLVSGGAIDVAGPYEAMEGSLSIIDDGDVELHSADDGVNAAPSDDSATTDGQGGMGGGGMEADGSVNLYVNGGTCEVWASGDGLDSNGNATITGGDIVVYGPTTDGNGALDVTGTFEVTGATLVATGSAGMMVAWSTDSAQGWIATALSATATAGSEVVITDADGAEVATYVVEKDFGTGRRPDGRLTP